MPRPAASPDPDDILSSLRRLVSEAGEPVAVGSDRAESAGPAPEQGADEPGNRDGSDGRLILTPALRVGGCEASARPDGASRAAQDADSTRAEEENEAIAEGDRDTECAPTGVDGDDAALVGRAEPDPVGAGEPETGEIESDDAGAPHGRRLHLDAAGDDGADAQTQQAERQDQEDEEEAMTFSHNEEEAESMAQAQEKLDYEPTATEDREPEDILLAEESEERILDEDTLREIVVQTVREELMGELGERITRNVKKLVRREIHRALASREFED